jgi:hypothetical protein
VKTFIRYSAVSFLVLVCFAFGQALGSQDANIALKNIGNLSLDLGSDYSISKHVIDENTGSELTMVLIHKVDDPLAGNATLTFMNIDAEEASDPKELASSLEMNSLLVFELAGLKELANKTVKNRNDQDISIHELSLPESDSAKGANLEYGLWSINEDNYAILLSDLGINTTTKIAEAFAISTTSINASTATGNARQSAVWIARGPIRLPLRPPKK